MYGLLVERIKRYLTRDRITLHFKRSEFDCSDGTQYPEDFRPRLEELCKALEVIRKACGGRRVTITSGYRTKETNKEVGGSRRSQHLFGKAADFKVNGIDAREVYKIVLRLIKEGVIPKGGVGSYKSFVHYDQRGFNARWRV